VVDTTTRSEDQQLEQLGYHPVLRRGLGVWSTFSIGVATVAPVVGLYAIVPLGLATAGPSWVWVLGACLVLQLCTALVYGVLAGRYPLAGGPFQCARRLVGPRYAVFTVVTYVVAVSAALTTVAYLAAPWLSQLLLDRSVSGMEQVGWSAALLAVALGINSLGVGATKALVNLGIVCEIVASLGLGLTLIVGFRHHDFSVLLSNEGSLAAQHGQSLTAVLAAFAVCGWAFVGFDAGASVAEETVEASRSVPRAVVSATAVVGLVVMVVAIAVILSRPGSGTLTPQAVADPILDAVLTNLGDWARIPFLSLVCITFVACVLSMQTYLGRVIFAAARERVLPGGLRLDEVAPRSAAPVRAMALASILAGLGLILGLNPRAIGTMITFGTGGLYITFWLVVAATAFALLTGRWHPLPTRRSELGFRATVGIALAWLSFEVVNIAWPRSILAAPGASGFEVWAVSIVFGLVAIVTGLTIVIGRPERRMRPVPED
jgi:amino acid transporter